MLRAKGLSFAYRHGSVEPYGHGMCLNDVSLCVERGERVALLGRNGSGKSTLLRCLALMLPVDPAMVQVDGVAPCAPGDEWDVRSKVGYVGQDPDDQIVASTVFEEVAFGPCNLGLSADAVRGRVHGALEACGLAGLEEADVAALSGGQKQRLAMAGVVAMEPSYLLLDEPCSMLDRGARRLVLELVDGLARKGCGVLHVTHELSDVLDYDRVYVMDGGRAVWSGAPRELMADPKALDASRCLLPVEGAASRAATPDLPTCGADVLLRLEDVSFSYDGPVGGGDSFVRGASLAVHAGEVVLLAGKTGSGKTTLAKLATGLLSPQAGTVALDGCPVRPGAVGYAFQRPEDQLFAETVVDDVAYGPLNLGRTPEQARAEAERALEFVGLDPSVCGGLCPFELSGGQMRRVALAGVLAMGARVVVFDEPTVGFDAAGLREFVRVLDRLAARGTGVVLITHDVERLLGHAHTAVLMSEGRVAWSGPAGGFWDAAGRYGYGAS